MTTTKESPPTDSPSHSASPSHSDSPSHSGSTLEGQALVDALKKQLEFYFSPQNLATDAYLTSRMNAQKYVPIDVIANFRKVKYLTEDRELLLKVMRQCKNLACDETGKLVRPTMKMERKTLLLRDIPSNTTEEEVRGIFDDNCGKVVSVRSDIGDTWYVNFETEDDCVNTAMYLNSKMFKGKPIRCRVKSENLLRGYFFHSPSRDPSQRWGAEGYYDLPPMSYAYHDPYAYPDQHWQGYPDHGEMTSTQYDPKDRRGGRRGGGDSRKNRGGGGARRKKGQYRKQYTEDTDKSAPTTTETELGPEHFPALPTTTAKKPASLVGYSKPFLKYSREHMASVVEQLNQKGIAKPDSFEGHDTVVIRSTPSTSCQLMVPFPVMYPASPSPFLAAQPHHSSQLPSYLYLGGFEDVEALPLPEHSFSIPHESQGEVTTHSLSGSFRPEMDGEVPKGQDTKLLDMLQEENSTAAAKKSQVKSSSMRDEAKAKGPPAEGKSIISLALKSESPPEPPKSAPEHPSKGKGKPQKARSGGAKGRDQHPKGKKKQSGDTESKSDGLPKLSYAEMARRAPQISPVKKSSVATTK